MHHVTSYGFASQDPKAIAGRLEIPITAPQVRTCLQRDKSAGRKHMFLLGDSHGNQMMLPLSNALAGRYTSSNLYYPTSTLTYDKSLLSNIPLIVLGDLIEEGDIVAVQFSAGNYEEMVLKGL